MSVQIEIQFTNAAGNKATKRRVAITQGNTVTEHDFPASQAVVPLPNVLAFGESVLIRAQERNDAGESGPWSVMQTFTAPADTTPPLQFSTPAFTVRVKA